MGQPRLQQELKKRNPFESLEQEATLAILRTNDQVQICFTRLFREYGLTASQYNVLRILRGEGGPLPILEIAQRTVTVVPGITGLVDRLEKTGLVKRERCLEDRRVIFVGLTQKGNQLLATLDQPVVDLHEKLMKGVTASELKEVVRVLEKMRSCLSDELNG